MGLERKIYFDNAATTPIRKEVQEAMCEALMGILLLPIFSDVLRKH